MLVAVSATPVGGQLWEPSSRRREGFFFVQARRADDRWRTSSGVGQEGRRCRAEDEEFLRIFYYDCSPFSSTVKLPVSGADKTYGQPEPLVEGAGEQRAIRRADGSDGGTSVSERGVFFFCLNACDGRHRF